MVAGLLEAALSIALVNADVMGESFNVSIFKQLGPLWGCVSITSGSHCWM